MKKKTIILLVSVVVTVVLIAFFAVDYYIRDSESFYPEHFKVGKFVAVNNSGRYYWYDDENQCFTGEYTEVSFKAKGIIGTEYDNDKRYRVYGEIVYDGKELMDMGDYIIISTTAQGELCTIYFNMMITDTHLDGSGTDFIDNSCIFLLEEDYSKPLKIFSDLAGEESKIGYYGDDLEEAEASRKRESEIAAESSKN